MEKYNLALRITSSSAAILALVAAVTFSASGQTAARLGRERRVSETTTASVYAKYESARSDKFTGGNLKRAKFVPGDGDIRVTVDVPAFRLTLWQSDAVVSTYPVGIGLAEFPVPIGERQVMQLIWNPAWIPPASGWVQESKRVKPGEIITADDPRNPLGKMKIPLGNGYLIHEARSVGDLGNLVSHGCIRMLRKDIYDLAEKIVIARGLPVSAVEIARAKRTTKQLVAELDEPLTVDLNYDTQVIEGDMLYLYPDVYSRGTNIVQRLRYELESNNISPDAVDEKTYKLLLERPTMSAAFVTPVASVKRNLPVTHGKLKPLVPTPSKPTTASPRKRTARQR